MWTKSADATRTYQRKDSFNALYNLLGKMSQQTQSNLDAIVIDTGGNFDVFVRIFVHDTGMFRCLFFVVFYFFFLWFQFSLVHFAVSLFL